MNSIAIIFGLIATITVGMQGLYKYGLLNIRKWKFWTKDFWAKQ